uniref:DRG2 n=1 Tax=Heterorhabditis bacteriophora TaxID=37862 RepID=A0A1I7WX43_HETBA
MSTTPIEVAEEALEKKVEAMKIVDRNSVETKNETDETKPEKRERKVLSITKRLHMYNCTFQSSTFFLEGRTIFYWIYHISFCFTYSRNSFASHTLLIYSSKMSILQKIADIEAEMAKTQKNKATNAHLGILKAKLAKLRRELITPKGGGGSTGEGFDVAKTGDARIGFVGQWDSCCFLFFLFVLLVKDFNEQGLLSIYIIFIYGSILAFSWLH